jgi:hypothetical protein
MDGELESLIEKSWNQWDKYGDPGASDFIKEVCPVPPILFVGDRNAYKNSKIKVITVALNPSKNGAKKEIHEKEFPRWKSVTFSNIRVQPEEYLKGLEEYFYKDPNRNYFNAFEPILNGMETSFYVSGKGANQSFHNIALHTDLCSQLTTDPNWGGLGDGVKQKLAADASSLWEKLMMLFKPNLVLASFGEAHLKWIKLPPSDMKRQVEDINTWDTTFKIGEKPFIVNGLLFNDGSKNQHNSLFARGHGSRRPFMIKDEYKNELGRQLLQYLKDHGII